MASVEIEADGDVRRIWLNRPDRRNALRPVDVEALLAALRSVQSDERARCVLLAGRGGSLCAGGDLADDTATNASQADRHLEGYQDVLATIMQLRQPVVTVLEGAAVGAGVALALAADVCIAAADSRLILPWLKWGLVPDMGVALLLTRRVGAARAKASLLASRTVSAHDAVAWGLILEVAADPWPSALAWSARLAGGPPMATALTKRLVNQAAYGGIHDYLALERSSMAALFGTDEPASGMAAFVEQRRPRTE